jgi:hypothetical protein
VKPFARLGLFLLHRPFSSTKRTPIRAVIIPEEGEILKPDGHSACFLRVHTRRGISD